MPPAPETVDDYIAAQPAEVRPLLEEVRRAIHAGVPEPGEKISYGIPTVTLGGHGLVSFAAWKRHIGVYPIPEGDAEFQLDIAPYRDAKSTARFVYGEPVPVELITRLALFRVAEQG